jgi:nucleoid-associated protein YgaU
MSEQDKQNSGQKEDRLPEEDRQSGSRQATPQDYRSMGTRRSDTAEKPSPAEERSQAQSPKGFQRPDAAAQPPAAEGKAASRYTAQHTVVEGETLSHIALKYYGSAAKEHWTRIYEANRDVIGDNPNKIRVGQLLNIPE